MFHRWLVEVAFWRQRRQVALGRQRSSAPQCVPLWGPFHPFISEFVTVKTLPHIDNYIKHTKMATVTLADWNSPTSMAAAVTVGCNHFNVNIWSVHVRKWNLQTVELCWLLVLISCNTQSKAKGKIQIVEKSYWQRRPNMRQEENTVMVFLLYTHQGKRGRLKWFLAWK